MINVSTEVRNAIGGNGRSFYLNVYINGRLYTSLDTLSAKIMRGSCGSQPVSGSMFIPSAEVVMKQDVSGTAVEGGSLRVVILVKGVSGNRAIDFGPFVISNVKVSNGITTISGIGRLSTIGNREATITSTDVSGILHEVSVGAGIEIRLVGVEETGSFEEPPTGSWRSVMQEIAVKLGGFLTEDNLGRWTIAKFCSGSTVDISADRSQESPEYDQTYTLEGVDVESGVADFTMGNPLLDPWDVLNITDIGGNTHLLPCLKIEHTIHGGIETSIDATVETAIQEEAKIEGPINGIVQHFWFDINGAHVTDVTKQEFLEDPDNAGGNLLARSDGISARNGQKDLARFGTDGIFLYNEDKYPLFRVETGSSRTTSFCSDGPFYDEDEADTTGKISTEPIAGGEITVILESAYIFSFTYGTAGTDSTEHVHGEYQIKHTVSYDGEITFTAHAQTRSNPSEEYGDPYSVRIITIFYYANTFQPLYTVGSSVGDRGGFSNTFGEGLKAEAKWQFVVGSFNDNIVDDVFEVGVGSDDDNRKTMFAVSGDGMYGGDVYESAMDTAGKNAGFMAHRTDTGRKVFLCVSTDGQNVGVWDTNKSNWIIRHDGSGNSYTTLGQLVDQISSSGATGTWIWRKWTSGMAMCYGIQTAKVSSWTAWGSLYYGTMAYFSYPSGLFVAEPTITANAKMGGGSNGDVFSLGFSNNGTAARTPSMYVTRPATGLTGNCYYHIQAWGRWK